MVRNSFQGTFNIEILEVLLFEDNPSDRDFLEHHLLQIKEKNIRLDCCETLSTGLMHLKQHQPDVVLLDFFLPDSSGIDSVRKIKNQYPLIPVVILTGADDDELAMQALQAGAQDYLIKKMINTSLLTRSINYAIERQRGVSIFKGHMALFENSKYAIIGKSLDGIILNWNKGAELMFGYSVAEIAGSSIERLIPKDSPDTAEILLGKIKSANQREATLCRKDGKEILVTLSLSPIKDAAGTIIAQSLVAHDLSREKLVQTELREMDERLKLAVNAAQIGLWDWDFESKQMRWDDGMFRLFGLPEGIYVPTLKRFLACIDKSDRKLLRNAVKQKGAFDFDCRTVLSTATTNVQMKGEVFYDKSGAPQRMTGVCFDITERKAAERALKASEHRVRLAVESAHMGVWEISFADGSMSRSMMHDGIFGYNTPPPEWNLKVFLSQVVDEDRMEVIEKLKLARTTGRINAECRVRHAANGSLRWIAWQGESSNDEQGNERMVGTVLDITESKNLEQLTQEAQERSNQLLRSIVEHAPIGIVILDSDLTIVASNAAFLDMSGCELLKIVNKPLVSVLPYQEILDAAISIAAGKPIQISKLEVKTIGHQPGYWDLSLWPVENVQHKMTGAVLQVSDRTQTVLLEHQRDDFVASVAHDIKNPLIGASQILDLLCNQSSKTTPASQTVFLSALKDSNQNLLSLVQNLVDVYRYETLEYPCEPETVELSTLFESVISQLAHFAETHTVTITSKIETPLVSVQADAIGLRRVLMNLLHNAVKFNKPGGKVEIVADLSAGCPRICVTDTGYGMSQSDQESLFQRFAQGSEGKRFANGTGIGLYLSKQIMDAHKGTLTCQSEVGAGTTFCVSLPAQHSAQHS